MNVSRPNKHVEHKKRKDQADRINNPRKQLKITAML